MPIARVSPCTHSSPFASAATLHESIRCGFSEEPASTPKAPAATRCSIKMAVSLPRADSAIAFMCSLRQHDVPGAVPTFECCSVATAPSYESGGEGCTYDVYVSTSSSVSSSPES